jgi:acyl carrier protein
MNRDEILEELRTIIVETRGVEDDEVTPEATLFDDLGLESIDFLEISFRMEESFGFPFPTDDLGNIMNSVGENSTTEDVNSALDALTNDFHMSFDRSAVEGVSPFDAAKLQSSVLTLFTVGSLVNFVAARSASA